MRKKSAGRASLLEYLGMVIIGLGIGWLVGMSVSPVVSAVIASVTGVAAAIISAMSGLEGGELGQTAGTEGTGDSAKRWSLNPWPLAMLAIGLFFGSIIGVWTRNHDLLGDRVPAEIERWAAITGLPQEEIGRRLFELEYPYTSFGGDAVWTEVGATRSLTNANALESELEIWEKYGLERSEVARRLFDLTYPSTGELLGLAEKSVAPKLQQASTETSLMAFKLPAEDCERLAGLPESQFGSELGAIEGLEKLPEIIEDPNTLTRIVEEVLCTER